MSEVGPLYNWADIHQSMFGPCVFPSGTPCCEFPSNTKAHFVLEKTCFTNKRILCECKYLEDCLDNCFNTSGKKVTLIFCYYRPNSRNSRLEQAKWVYIGHYFNAPIP